MTCQDFEPLLSAYLDRELKADDQKEVARHVESCARCRADVHALLAVKEQLRAQPLPSIPADLVADIEARTLREERPWTGLNRWWIPVLTVATAAATWAILQIHKPVIRSVPLTLPVAQATQKPLQLVRADSDTTKNLQ